MPETDSYPRLDLWDKDAKHLGEMQMSAEQREDARLSAKLYTYNFERGWGAGTPVMADAAELGLPPLPAPYEWRCIRDVAHGRAVYSLDLLNADTGMCERYMIDRRLYGDTLGEPAKLIISNHL